ncbi:FAD-dependent monooxygenase [Micromonospora sp. NBC_01739]|uniref:FAD-dependent monooxygenase n=1 Tax=unclassified Micromonospora TaxID=2617518 RepID=UPI002E0EF631|nr:FAD-dependent monooxygenase [Micromonospora sp. NBC_01739]
MSRVIIAGGGIGGLATALALARTGHQVTVLEKAARFAEIGAGIQLAPNGLHALDQLGVGATVRAGAVRMDELRFMDGVTGEHVTSLELTETYRRRFGRPYVVVHRAELHTALLDACRDTAAIELRSDAPVLGYGQEDLSAWVTLADGERVEGEVVIGADGLHSAIRQQMVGDGDPIVSGITVYRAVVEMDRVPADLRYDRSVVWWAGPGCHFVHYPIAGGRYLNLAASSVDGSTTAVAGRPVSRERARAEFPALGGTAQRLLALGEEWKTWTLVDREPVDTWTEGRVALLGDAAHPMLHYAAQGACQALEDAVVLARHLTPGASPEAGLRGYAAERAGRTAAVQRAARNSVVLWHPAGAAARRRNERLRGLSQQDLREHLAWMHGTRVAGAPVRPTVQGVAA